MKLVSSSEWYCFISILSNDHKYYVVTLKSLIIICIQIITLYTIFMMCNIKYRQVANKQKMNYAIFDHE